MYLSLPHDSMCHDNINQENVFCSKNITLYYIIIYICVYVFLYIIIVNKSIIFKLHHQFFLNLGRILIYYLRLFVISWQYN